MDINRQEICRGPASNLPFSVEGRVLGGGGWWDTMTNLNMRWYYTNKRKLTTNRRYQRTNICRNWLARMLVEIRISSSLGVYCWRYKISLLKWWSTDCLTDSLISFYRVRTNSDQSSHRIIENNLSLISGTHNWYRVRALFYCFALFEYNC